ncbi:MAG: glycoside hydrolase family 20 zincin-like fold domain-containing protein, partial [Terracidiphilus sp.]
MRLHFSLVPALLVCAVLGVQAQPAAPSCADLHVVPAPRECTAVASIAIGEPGLTVTAAKNADDEFTAKDLEEALKGAGAASSLRGVVIHLEPADTATAKRLLDESKLSFDPAMHDEGYVIVPDGKHGLAVIAQTSTGLFYGAQTVKQLIRGSGKYAVLLVPTVRDWPAMKYRGLSDDWSRGPLPNMDFVKREIRTLA